MQVHGLNSQGQLLTDDMVTPTESSQVFGKHRAGEICLYINAQEVYTLEY